MRYISGAAQYVPDGMTRAHGHATNDWNHRLPSTYLASQTRIQIRAIGFYLRQCTT